MCVIFNRDTELKFKTISICVESMVLMCVCCAAQCITHCFLQQQTITRGTRTECITTNVKMECTLVIFECFFF